MDRCCVVVVVVLVWFWQWKNTELSFVTPAPGQMEKVSNPPNEAREERESKVSEKIIIIRKPNLAMGTSQIKFPVSLKFIHRESNVWMGTWWFEVALCTSFLGLSRRGNSFTVKCGTEWRNVCTHICTLFFSPPPPHLASVEPGKGGIDVISWKSGTACWSVCNKIETVLYVLGVPPTRSSWAVCVYLDIRLYAHRWWPTKLESWKAKSAKIVQSEIMGQIVPRRSVHIFIYLHWSFSANVCGQKLFAACWLPPPTTAQKNLSGPQRSKLLSSSSSLFPTFFSYVRRPPSLCRMVAWYYIRRSSSGDHQPLNRLLFYVAYSQPSWHKL